MKHDQLKKFISLDTVTWTALLRQFGFAGGACYRIRDDALTLVIHSDSGNEESQWPAVASFSDNYNAIHSSNYTTNSRQDLPFGWFKPNFNVSQRKIWPKGTIFYFPVQDLWQNKFIFTMVDPPGRRRVVGELDGGLEACVRKISFWLDNNELSHFVSEVAFQEHIRGIGADLRNAIDHEIRTPLASIIGYANLLTSEDLAPEETLEFRRIISEQALVAVEAINKVSQSLATSVPKEFGGDGDEQSGSLESVSVDISVLLKQLCERLKKESLDLVGKDASQRLKVIFRIVTDSKCRVHGSVDMLSWAFWEVLKNAALYAGGGSVLVNLYTADRHVVVDIQDDGQGVSAGAEDLIFLRFYRDPSGQVLRRGKRGLGLGLFLARYLTEKHLGELKYVRSRPGESKFRFVFPLDKSADDLKLGA